MSELFRVPLREIMSELFRVPLREIMSELPGSATGNHVGTLPGSATGNHVGTLPSSATGNHVMGWLPHTPHVVEPFDAIGAAGVVFGVGVEFACFQEGHEGFGRHFGVLRKISTCSLSGFQSYSSLFSF